MLVIPYTPALLRPETARWGVLHGAEFCNVSWDRSAYWALLSMLWSDAINPGPLFIVEHDIIPNCDAFREMRSCDRMWCTSPYQIRGDGHETRNSLGFAKFSYELRYVEADLLMRIGPGQPESQADALWSRLDGAISESLTRKGYEPHCHQSSVHLHDYTDPRTPWVDPYGGNNGKS